MILSAATPSPTRPRIVVVRDRERAVLQHPHPREFRGRYDMSYLHLAETERLPAADHVVFNCERTTERVHDLVRQALAAHVIVTVITGRVDATCAALADTRAINLLPAYGVGGHMTPGTLRNALAAIVRGTAVVAAGFVKSSLATPGELRAPSARSLLQLLAEASAFANSGTSVVAAVLAPHRSGSKFLHDAIGWTVSGAVTVLHEHEVPLSVAVMDAGRPPFDQLATAPALEQNALRRAILRQALLGAERRYIFVTVRDPRARLVSYYLLQRKRLLRRTFDSERRTFDDMAAIQADFDEFAWLQTKRQRSWYRLVLQEPFGLNVLDARPTEDGVLVAVSGPNTLVAVATDRLDEHVAALGRVYGADAYAPLHDNSARSRGDAAIAQAFSAQIGFTSKAWAKLVRLPEVAYLHQQLAAGRLAAS